MELIHVIPLSRGVFRDQLTYFSAKPLPAGALVEIPLRQKFIPALVVESEPVTAARAALRSAAYALKKIRTLKAPPLVRPEFVAAARAAADRAAASLGPVLRALLPQAILAQAANLRPEAKNFPEPADNLAAPEIAVLQDADEHRISFYRSLIREHFARGASVIFCLPSVAELEKFFQQLERGIAEYTFVLHAQLAAKEQLGRWQAALRSRHPILALVTPSFLSLPRPDLATIILEREPSEHYERPARPHFDWRVLATELARHYRARLIFADLTLSLPTFYAAANRLYQPLAPLKQRIAGAENSRLLPHQGGAPLGPELLAELTEGVAGRDKILVLANRRGLAPLVVCEDCGATVLCRRCQSPVALHELSREEKIFFCHHCGGKRSAKENCAVCQSWRLKELGVGSARVEQLLSAALAPTRIWRFDSDTIKTPAAGRKLMDQFLAAPGGLLVATEMALAFLPRPVDFVVALGLDGLFARPDYRTQEILFRLVVRLRALARRRFVLQTRFADEALFAHALRGDLANFYREEIASREQFGYPPFKLLIKVTGETPEAVKGLKTKFAAWQPLIYPSFLGPPGRPGARRYHLLLKLNPSAWPEPGLLAHLKSLPPSFIVKVGASEIL